MDKSYEYLIDILKLSVCEADAKSPHADFSCINAPELEGIFSVAEFHSVEHIVSKYLSTREELFNERLYSALIFDTDLAEIKTAFNQAGIDFIALKGAHLRQLYPERWMRSSLDIDILVREEDVKRATDLLVDEHGYKHELDSGHHDVLKSRTGWMVELHFGLTPFETAGKALLDKAWDYAVKADESELALLCQDHVTWDKDANASAHEYLLTPAFFYFYHIYHMAHHFLGGGPGIRSILDLWLLIKNKYDVDSQELIEIAGLTEFEKNARALAFKWFGDAPEYPEGLTAMEDFILAGGARGTKENIQLIRSTKTSGKMKFMLSRIFLPAYIIKSQYPLARKYGILVPFYEVRRWLIAIFRDGGANLKEDMAERNAVDNADANATAKLIEKLGLEEMH